MTGFSADYNAYLFLFLAGFCATQPWRWLGLVLSRGVSEDSEILTWVRAVSTALVAGLVSRMILIPAGALAGVAIEIRLGAFVLGLVVYFASKRSLAAGVFTAAGALIAIQQFITA